MQVVKVIFLIAILFILLGMGWYDRTPRPDAPEIGIGMVVCR